MRGVQQTQYPRHVDGQWQGGGNPFDSGGERLGLVVVVVVKASRKGWLCAQEGQEAQVWPPTCGFAAKTSNLAAAIAKLRSS